MKKKIFAYILLMLPALLMTSCLKDQEDKFSDSATERSSKYLADIKMVLTSSENGWILNYYPDREQSYGGFAYTLIFDNQNVTVGTEIAEDITETITTTYMLDNENGPTISFDTYNDYLHYFSTPTAASGAGGYQAYDGDFIFTIMSVSEDQNTITLKGNRTGNIMYMHRNTDSTSEEYLNSVVNLKNTMAISYLIPDGTTEDGEPNFILVSLSNGTAVFVGDDTDIDVAYHYTDDGIEFYEPITVQGHKITGITYGGEAEAYPAMGDESLLLYPQFIPVNEMFVMTDAFFAYSKVSDTLKPLFDEAKALSDDENEIVGFMAFKNMSGNFGFYFTSGRYGCFAAYQYELIGEDQIKLTYNPQANQGSTGYYYRYGYNSLIDYLGSTTFTVESDSDVRPSYFKLTDNEDPDKYFTLSTSQISTPFDK